MTETLKGLYYKTKRRILRLSQSEVADSIGISRYTLAKYEMGITQIPLTTAIRWQSLFDESEKLFSHVFN